MLLYRGTPDRCSINRLPQWLLDRQPVDACGRWFTDDLDVVKWYVDDAPHGVLVAVDVPPLVVSEAWVPNQSSEVRRFSLDPDKEFFLPREWADKAYPI